MKKTTSNSRHIHLNLEDSIAVKENLTAKIKDPDFPSKKKTRIEITAGDDWSVDNERHMKKERIIDKRKNRYYEKVSDPTTGKTIHECDEKLTSHQNHGHAKYKNNK